MKIAHYRWFTHAKWWSSRARLLDRLENIGVFSIFLDGDFQEATNESVQLSKEIWYDIDLGSKDYDVRILENYIWWCNDLGILEMKLMMIVVGLKLMMILEVKLIPVMILEVKLMMWAYVTVTCHIIYIFIYHITQFFELSSNSWQCPQKKYFLNLFEWGDPEFG